MTQDFGPTSNPCCQQCRNYSSPPPLTCGVTYGWPLSNYYMSKESVNDEVLI